MHALVIPRLSDPETLEIQQVPDPKPQPGEEIIQVKACGVNFADLLMAKEGYHGTPKPPVIAGREFCGIRQSDGQRVMGYVQWGAFAEWLVVRPTSLWPVPQDWKAEEGAAFPVNYFTAYLAYWKAGLLEKPAGGISSRVLVHAVGGGVGTAAVQIGKLLGLEMYGTASSEEKLDRAKQLGLQHGINYKHRDYEGAIKELTHGEGVDAVFEMLGGEHTTKSVRCLRDFGCVIVYGRAGGEKSEIDTGILYAKGASVHGLWLTYLAQKTDLMNMAWKQLSGWIEQGHLRPVVGHVLPYTKAAQAYRLLQERNNFGKVVLCPM
jgi:NADPH2:quinone reductase